MQRRSRSRLAAPIVVTFASLAAGCSASGNAGPPNMNPPPVREPAGNPPPVVEEPKPTGPMRVNPPPIHLANALPEPSPGAHIDRRADGTCYEFVNITCPPNVTCNPPPPHQVRCPAK